MICGLNLSTRSDRVSAGTVGRLNMAVRRRSRVLCGTTRLTVFFTMEFDRSELTALVTMALLGTPPRLTSRSVLIVTDESMPR